MEEKYATAEEAVRHMENSYDRGGKYVVNGRPRYVAAAVQLEDKTGLKGIAGRYKFIGGAEPAFAEYGYRKRFRKFAIAEKFLKSGDPIQIQAAQKLTPQFAEALKEINEEHKKLLELNPELKKLNFNKASITESYHALIGVTSQYNPDDVNSYLQNNIRQGKINRPVHDRINQITQKTGIRFGWQPSEKTMDKIERQLAVRSRILEQKSR